MFKNPLRILSLATFLAGLFALFLPHVAFAGPITLDFACRSLKYIDSINQIFVFDWHVIFTSLILVGLGTAISWLGVSLRLKKTSAYKDKINIVNLNLIFSIAYLFFILLLSFSPQGLFTLANRAFINPMWVQENKSTLGSSPCTVTNYSLNLAGRFLLASLIIGVVIILGILVYRQIVSYRKAKKIDKLHKIKKTNPWLKAFIILIFAVVLSYVIISYLSYQFDDLSWDSLGL